MGRRQTPQELRDLIFRMVAENRGPAAGSCATSIRVVQQTRRSPGTHPHGVRLDIRWLLS